MTVVRAGKGTPESKADGGTTAITELADEPLARRSRSWRSVALTAVRVAFTLAIIAAIVHTVVGQWPQVEEHLSELAWHSVLLSLVMVLGGLGAATLAWRAACEGVGHRVSVRTASQIYLIGLLAKYLPGSVWAFILQMELGKRANLPRARAFMASLVTVGIGVTVSLLFGLFGLPALDAAGRGVAVSLIVLIPISLICAHPRVLTWLVQLSLRVLRRPALGRAITWTGVGKIAFWSMISFVANGAHLWLLAGNTSVSGLMGLLRCIGAISLGLTVGLFVFLVPSGIGVREAIIVTTLVMYVPNEGAAIAMAVTSRLIFIVGDLIAAGAAALAGAGSLGPRVRALTTRAGSALRLRS